MTRPSSSGRCSSIGNVRMLRSQLYAKLLLNTSSTLTKHKRNACTRLRACMHAAGVSRGIASDLPG